MLLQTLPQAVATEVLEWLLINESAAGEELSLAWSEQEAGLGPLEALDPSKLAKPARKTLRRAIHRMRSRGFEVKAEPAATHVARLPSLEEGIEAALVSPLDPRGSRMVYLVLSHPAGGARVYEALIDEQEGLVEFRIYDTGRSRARKFLRDLAQRRSAAMVEVDVASARGLLARTEKNHPATRPLPRGFVEARSLLALDAAGEVPGDQVREALSAAEDVSAAIGRLEARIAGHDLGPWPAPAASLEAVATKLQEQSSGGLVVSESTRQDRVRDILREAASEVYDAELRAVTARRLREEAFLAWRDDREDQARDCLAGAEAFESEGEAGELAVTFLHATLEPLIEQMGEAPVEEEEPPSLIAKP
jgi:hypothetical protein